MKATTTITLIAILCTTISSFSQKCKQQFPEGKHLINTDEAGKNIAMEGYDLTSFFIGKPVKGNENIASSFEGITYLFANEENQKAFDKEPTMYMPQYGGFCAVAMYFGKTEELQTYELYDVVNGKLYFNRNEKAKKLWDKKGPKKVIKRSDKNWNCAVAKLGLNIDEAYKEPESIK